MKALKITGITLAVLLVILIAVPQIFSGPIEKAVKKYINEMVTAEVEYDDFSLSIFSSFPDLRAGLEGLRVVGEGRFSNDTLISVGTFGADIDILSALTGNININAVLVNDAKVKAIVAADSTANWDIMVPSETAEEPEVEEEADTTASSLMFTLEKVALSNANITYIDSTGALVARIAGLNLNLNGNMDMEHTLLNLALGIDGIDVEMEGIGYLNQVPLTFDAQIDADLANNKYTFNENTLNFGGVPLAFDGWAQLGDSSTAVDMKLAAKETTFKTILALVPEYILKDVEGLRADGSLELYAKVTGEYIDMEHIPAIDALLKVQDGKIQYPDLPKSLNDININVAVNNPGGSADATTVDVNTFHFELGNNPFDASLNLATPISNAAFAAKIKGIVDLNSLKEAIPLDSMTIGGIVDANIAVATDMNTITREDYEKVKADGTLGLKQFTFESADLPYNVDVPEAKLKLTPKYMELNPLKVNVGKSDFDVTGRLENYLAYALKDGTIKGNVSLKSKLIDCNELMGSESAATDTAATAVPAEATSTTEESQMVEIPANIDFTFTTAIDKVLFDKLELANIAGAISVKDAAAMLNNVNMNACNGTFALNGKYSTKVPEKPTVDMAIGMNNVDINVLTNSFSTIDSLLPIAKSAYGKVNINLDIETELDKEMSPVMPTLNGKGSFRSESIELKESDFQKKLVKLLKNDKYGEVNVKDCNVVFTIENGNIVVAPFKLKMFGKQATMQGKQGLDQTMDYLLNIPLSRAEVASMLSGVGLNVKSTEGADIPVGIEIKGVLTKPELGLNLDEAKKTLANETKQKVEEKLSEVKEEAKEKIAEKVTEKLNENEKLKEGVEKAKDKLNDLFKRR